MLSAIGWIFKLLGFSVLVLVLGNLFHWNGRTISDQVRSQMSRAEHLDTVHRVKGWAGNLVDDSRQGSKKQTSSAHLVTKNSASVSARADSDIPESERDKLRALIQELNHSHSR